MGQDGDTGDLTIKGRDAEQRKHRQSEGKIMSGLHFHLGSVHFFLKTVDLAIEMSRIMEMKRERNQAITHKTMC